VTRSSSPARLAQLTVRRVLRMALVLGAFSCLLAAAGVAAAEDAVKPLPDKGGYNLFNPTPRELIRELTPDRPDKTESPYTVDAGHIQLELDAATFTLNRSNDARTEAWNIAPVNFKIGLLNNVDLQFIFDNYLYVRTEDRHAHKMTTQSGVGDLTTRLKINLWGNDGGQTAFGILPFVKFPTNTDHLGNDAVEGGVIFPLAVKLPAGWDLGLETGSSLLRNEQDRGYHVEFVNSVTLGHEVIGKLGGYLEFFSSVSTEPASSWVGTVDLGLTYGLTDNIQLDAGVNLGVTRSADDVEVFTGFTVRF
jgi:Putative MetA-pathway of phenol degradation